MIGKQAEIEFIPEANSYYVTTYLVVCQADFDEWKNPNL
jgi:hypothetical protein